VSPTYIVRKTGELLLTLYAVVTFNFLLFHVIPGNPVQLIARSQHLNHAAVQQIRQLFGLNHSLPVQYGQYLVNLLHGNLGFSYTYRQSVRTIVAQHLWNTLILLTASTIIVILLGIGLGVFAAARNGRRADTTTVLVSLVFWSLPTFWIGLLLVFVFGVWISNGLPISGITTPNAVYPNIFSHFEDVARHLVLPTLTLALVDIAQFILITRSSLVDVLTEDYIVTAKAKGLSRRAIVWRHGVRSALLPVLTASTLYISGVVGGAIQVEAIFSWPGMGQLIYQAVLRRDYPVLEACFLVFAVVVILGNFISDLLYRVLDPRVREGV
jgi:peptide/nickel transport system permease protein